MSRPQLASAAAPDAHERARADACANATVIELGRDSLTELAAASQREWLVTNGLGGFASGTVSGLNTRRYHGLLVAALRPPVERTLMVAALDATVRYGGVTTALATHEYLDGTIAPEGYRHLLSFRLDGAIPVWTWAIGEALLEQRVWMAHGENTTYVSYQLRRGPLPLELELQPLCSSRDYHWQLRGSRDASVRALDQGFEVIDHPGALPCRVLLEGARYVIDPQWHWNIRHREEGARGLDEGEDLLRPAIISARLAPGEVVTVILTAESRAPLAAAESLQREQQRQHALLQSAGLAHAALARPAPDWVQQLVLSADQFIVDRHDMQGNALGKTIIAGYPWFSDWGRDTMIALPGLTLAVGRHDIAASVLRTFAQFVDQGMLPNRFPDGGESPEYNTVDATLWYFVAIREYLRTTSDSSLRTELYPALKDIIAWHRRGTRYGIRMDASDALLYAGEAGVQLTWMDAKVGDWVVTPRIGKCVEINALWYHALTLMGSLAREERDVEAAREFTQLASRVARSYNERFWHEAGSCLFDVVDGPEGEQDEQGRRRDATVRPNQILAVSLTPTLLEPARARAVLERCARELWTPMGLRSLAPSDASYVSVYQGGPRDRDGAYHQGTVWSWLLGPFVSAHLHVHGDVAAAREFASGMGAHLREACVGQVSEIFDGGAPFRARGCYAQAWGVAELLRIWSELNERES
jgi:predicted glycogen debranching enzyme